MMTADEARISLIIKSVAVLADLRDFDNLEKLYADNVHVDYSALDGGEPEVISSKELLSRWANLLPGFDVTHHDVSNINIKISGETAQVSAHIVADHYLNDQDWQVKGSHHYELYKQHGYWRITFHQFKLTEEIGGREILNDAMENAKKSPVAYLAHQ